MSRTPPELRRKMLKEHQRCELCGDTRNLEVHHVVPACVGGPDIEDNLLVVCGVCHAKLTPKSVLTKMGLRKVMYPESSLGKVYARFYKILERLEDDRLTDTDVIDIFDATVWSLGYRYVRKPKEWILDLFDRETNNE